MISNGSNKLVGASVGLPNMSQTIIGWFQPIIFGIVEKTLVDFEEVKTITPVNTQGVVQPAGYEILDIMPEGDRNWDIQEVHCLPNIQVKVGEFIYWNDLKYRILKRENFSEYGYMHYIVREAFEDE